MIQKGTELRVIDNTNASVVKCIGYYGKRKYAKVGEMILVTVRKVRKGGSIKKGTIHKGVIVRVRKEVNRKGGDIARSSDNAVVLLKKDKSPVGTRVLGPVLREVRNNGYTKVVSMAMLTI